MNFSGVAFVDAAYFTAAYVTKFKDKLETGEHGSFDRLPLRTDDVDAPILKDWKTARALLTKVRNAPAPILKGRPVKIRTAAIVSLPPQRIVDWSKTLPAEPGLTAYLPILPSPGAMLFCGLEAHSPPVGQLTLVNRAVPFSAMNLGSVTAVWLQVEAYLPDEE